MHWVCLVYLMNLALRTKVMKAKSMLSTTKVAAADRKKESIRSLHSKQEFNKEEECAKRNAFLPRFLFHISYS